MKSASSSLSNSSGLSSSARHKRRAPRAVVYRRAKGVYLKCPKLSEKEFKVYSISEFGIGIERIVEPPAAPQGVSLEATLRVGMTVAPLKLRYASATPSVLGFEFVQPSEVLRSAIRHYFEPELVGAELIIKQGPAAKDQRTLGKPYQLILEHPKGARVEIHVEAQEKLTRFTIEALGAKVTWERAKGFTAPVAEPLRKSLLSVVQNIQEIELSLRSAMEAAMSLLPVP